MTDAMKTARQTLHTYHTLKEKISFAEADLARLNSGSGLPDAKTARNIHQKIREWSALCLEIDQQIDKLPVPEREILRHRYIFGLPWEEIKIKTGIDTEQISDTHQRALRLLSRNIQ